MRDGRSFGDVVRDLGASPQAPACLWVAGLVCGLGSTPAGLGLLYLRVPPLVLGPLAIADPWYVVVLVLAALGVALLTLARRVRREAEVAGVRSARSRARVVVVTAVSVLAVALGVAAGALSTLLALVDTSYLLDPASPGGARVLVVQHSFLLMGSGDVYLVEPGDPVPRAFRSYQTDDGYDPIAAGDYALSWQGETPNLSIGGTLG